VATTRPTRPAPMTMMMREAVKEMKFLRLRMCEVVKERESKRDAFLIYIYIYIVLGNYSATQGSHVNLGHLLWGLFYNFFLLLNFSYI
jgi:hypothetical protein